MRALALALAFGLAATAALADADLAGSWTATAAERDGAPAADLVGHRLTFAGEAFEIAGADGAMIYAGTFRLDPAAVPAAIDLVNAAGAAAGVTWAGIYRLEGATLTIVDNAPDASRPRPADFTAPAGYVMVVFERTGANP